MRALAAPLVFAAVALALPGRALAAPPSGVEEYVLDIPSAGGDKHPAPGAAGTGTNDGAADRGGARKTTDRDPAKPEGGEQGPGQVELTTEGDGDSPLVALTGALTSGSGTGPLLPIVLLLAFAGAVVTSVSRRRGGGGPGRG